MSRGRSLADWSRGNIEVWNRGDREAEDMGDRVVGLVHFTARGRDGIETGRDGAYVVTGRDGVPMRTDNFATWAAALEAAGLSE
jgi:hypothetical protein